jgi:thioesterase domain-containing protein
MLINATREGKYVIPIHAGSASNLPLFAMPEYLLFVKLANYVNQEQPFYSIEKSNHYSDFDAAVHYIREIKKVYPRGPYCLVGFCQWAGIALEMAHQLREQGEEVPVLVLIEYYPHGSRYPRTSMRYINMGLKRFYRDLNENPGLPDKVKFIHGQLKRFKRFISKRVVKTPNGVIPYVPAPVKPYPGKVVLLSARERPFGFKEHDEMNWPERFIGQFENYIIDGDHLGIFSKKGPMQMGEKLNAIMEEVNKEYQLRQQTYTSMVSAE